MWVFLKRGRFFETRTPLLVASGCGSFGGILCCPHLFIMHKAAQLLHKESFYRYRAQREDIV